jgi:hypothetical protein
VRHVQDNDGLFKAEEAKMKAENLKISLEKVFVEIKLLQLKLLVESINNKGDGSKTDLATLEKTKVRFDQAELGIDQMF